DIVLLRQGAVREAAGQEIELAHADVRGQVSTPHRIRVLELRIAAEEPRRHGLQQAPLQLAPPAWPAERERRRDAQLEVLVLPRAPEELVDEVVRLAEPERGADVKAAADPPDR